MYLPKSMGRAKVGLKPDITERLPCGPSRKLLLYLNKLDPWSPQWAETIKELQIDLRFRTLDSISNFINDYYVILKKQ